MANQPKPIKATPPKERPPGIPDHIWNLPARLVEISEERNVRLYPSDIQAAAQVNQSTVSRWFRYEGLSKFSTPTLLRLEAGLGLAPGTLLPRGNTLSDPGVSRLAATLGLDARLLQGLKSKELGAAMQSYPQEARKAIMGVVHVYGVSLERAAEAVDRVIEKYGKTATKAFDAPTWYDRMRSVVESIPTDESGTHISVGKIPIVKRRG